MGVNIFNLFRFQTRIFQGVSHGFVPPSPRVWRCYVISITGESISDDFRVILAPRARAFSSSSG